MAFLPIAAAALSAVGTFVSAEAQSQNANYQSQVAANNAIIAKQNATAATAAGQEQAQQKSLQNAQQVGLVKAAQAANGVDVNSGSNVDVQVSQREKGQLDAETTLHNAQLQAYGYRTQSTNFEAQSALDKTEAEQAPIAGGLSAAGGLLGKANSLSFNWTDGGSDAANSNVDPATVPYAIDF